MHCQRSLEGADNWGNCQGPPAKRGQPGKKVKHT